MKKVLGAIILGMMLAPVAFADDSAEDVYKAKCKGCHGADGKADTKIGHKEKIPDMSTAEWQSKNSDEEIKKMIAEGSPKKGSKMKPFKEKLTEGEIASLVTYVRQMKK